MTQKPSINDFQTVLSIDPLLNFWRERVATRCSHMGTMFDAFEKKVADVPELQGDIDQPDVAARHIDILGPLMSVAFPSSTWDTEIAAAFKPFSHQAIYSTPAYRKNLLDEQGRIAGRLKGENNTLDFQRLIRSYALVLERIYGIEQGLDSPLVRIVTDSDTGLERYFQITPDFQFVQVGTVGKPPTLTDEDRERLIENITDPAVLTRLLPPGNFILRGFTVVRAVEVTDTEITSALERDLIDQQSIFSTDGFKRLQSRLCILFGQPNLKAGMGALQGDRVLILNDGHMSDANCLFTNSSHIPLSELENSIWLQAMDQKRIIRISNLGKTPNLCAAERDMIDHGVRSILVAPLIYGGEAIGTIWVKSDKVSALGAVDGEKMRHIAPLFSIALRRGLDDMNNEIQAIIKEKCTAVHPSVEWRFRQAAMKHMERLRQGESSEMETIVFKQVIPLFGQSDIRGSSEVRVKSIQSDLIEQLQMAGTIMGLAGDVKAWPMIDEYRFRIDQRIQRIHSGLSAEEERRVASFLKEDVEPCFDELRGFSPRVSRAVDRYERARDPLMGVVYRERRALEESVSMLNERLSAYLDKQQVEAQRIFPHYFEKHQTDGIDYVIYLGESMHPERNYHPFFLENLALWQINVACGLARQTQQIQSALKVPLETCHLILVNHTPLSIRFRYDEKRFDVDGAYDVRHEIIKSRLDKATVKGGRERLTQPGRIAIVYSQPEEGRNIRRHIDFLQNRGHLLEDLETIDLEDLPGIRGLKAFRISVNAEAGAVGESMEKLAG
jgi:hypothetical protein